MGTEIHAIDSQLINTLKGIANSAGSSKGSGAIPVYREMNPSLASHSYVLDGSIAKLNQNVSLNINSKEGAVSQLINKIK